MSHVSKNKRFNFPNRACSVHGTKVEPAQLKQHEGGRMLDWISSDVKACVGQLESWTSVIRQLLLLTGSPRPNVCGFEETSRLRARTFVSAAAGPWHAAQRMNRVPTRLIHRGWFSSDGEFELGSKRPRLNSASPSDEFRLTPGLAREQRLFRCRFCSKAPLQIRRSEADRMDPVMRSQSNLWYSRPRKHNHRRPPAAHC